MKKRTIIISSTLLIFIIIVTIFNSNKTLAKLNSPDSTYQIIIKYKPPFLKGTFKISIYYKEKSSLIKEHLNDTNIFYDGAHLSDGNYHISWENNIATLTLTGDSILESKEFIINMLTVPKITEVKKDTSSIMLQSNLM
ncbi:hypothetical protein [Clostridium polynesiense]|uniref:hypothetical protein n=1 Tax=Clostridium polynesiense TaxID=1325933 RepID=UPI00058ED787|nr:hypothetical protein [Clostridium polynesiense]